MKITTVGIDLAKNVIVVHGVDERGKAVLRTPLKRDQVAPFFANLPACRIGMEEAGRDSELQRSVLRRHHIAARNNRS